MRNVVSHNAVSLLPILQMVAEALSVEGRPLGLLQAPEEDAPPAAAMPDTAALVDSAVALVQAAPTAAFYVCDLLKAHSAQSTQCRQVSTRLRRWQWCAWGGGGITLAACFRHQMVTGTAERSQLSSPCNLFCCSRCCRR